MKTRKSKALILLSGGLDSRLVCKILEEQLGKENTEALFLKLPFGGGCCNDEFCVLRFAQTERIKLHILDCTKGRMFRRYMDIIKKPKFQRGTELNPCIDCHLFMLKQARKLAKKTGAKIIATGEVLGERPLSQNRRALALIEKEARLEVLRPLSARLLPETEAEQRGWIDRSKLLDIQGRRRVKQIALAKKYRISYPSPAGGCLLTDSEFARRLRDFLEHSKKITETDTELLKLGRHFRHGKSRIIVGRNEKENKRLLSLAKSVKPKPAILEAVDYMGPITLVFNPSSNALRIAAQLTVRYSDAPKGKTAKIEVKTNRKRAVLRARAMPGAGIAKIRV